MASPRKRVTRKKTAKKHATKFSGLVRLFSALFLLLVLLFSVCTVGYVIFFRTVFAKAILPSIKSAIIFEEPDPPVHMVPQENKIKIPAPELPKVAIIIDDMGYHHGIDKELMALPFELTYSFLPFAPYTSELEWLTYRSGKTVFLHLPLQPKGNEWDPGPGALSLKDSPDVQHEKLVKCLEQVPHAVGVNNHMGSLFTEDKKAMARLMKTISHRALYFVDSYTSSGSIGLQVAQELKVKCTRRHVFLDNKQDKKKICNQLQKLVNIAERSGVGIGIGHPYQVTVDALSSCAMNYMGRVQYVSIKDVLH